MFLGERVTALSYDPEVHRGQSLIFSAGCRKPGYPIRACVERRSYTILHGAAGASSPLVLLQTRVQLKVDCPPLLRNRGNWKPIRLYSAHFRNDLVAVERRRDVKVQRRCRDDNVHCRCERFRTEELDVAARGISTECLHAERTHGKSSFELNRVRPNNRLRFSLNLELIL